MLSLPKLRARSDSRCLSHTRTMALPPEDKNGPCQVCLLNVGNLEVQGQLSLSTSDKGAGQRASEKDSWTSEPVCSKKVSQ